MDVIYGGYTLRELVNSAQGIFKDGVLTLCIYKVKRKWYYYILEFEELDIEFDVLERFQRIDSKAFLVNGYESLTNYSKEDIMSQIKFKYNYIFMGGNEK